MCVSAAGCWAPSTVPKQKRRRTKERVLSPASPPCPRGCGRALSPHTCTVQLRRRKAESGAPVQHLLGLPYKGHEPLGFAGGRKWTLCLGPPMPSRGKDTSTGFRTPAVPRGRGWGPGCACRSGLSLPATSMASALQPQVDSLPVPSSARPKDGTRGAPGAWELWSGTPVSAECHWAWEGQDRLSPCDPARTHPVGCEL